MNKVELVVKEDLIKRGWHFFEFWVNGNKAGFAGPYNFNTAEAKDLADIAMAIAQGAIYLYKDLGDEDNNFATDGLSDKAE